MLMQTTTFKMLSHIETAGHPQLESILWVGEINQPNQEYYHTQFSSECPHAHIQGVAKLMLQCAKGTAHTQPEISRKQ